MNKKLSLESSVRSESSIQSINPQTIQFSNTIISEIKFPSDVISEQCVSPMVFVSNGNRQNFYLTNIVNKSQSQFPQRQPSQNEQQLNCLQNQSTSSQKYEQSSNPHQEVPTQQTQNIEIKIGQNKEDIRYKHTQLLQKLSHKREQFEKIIFQLKNQQNDVPQINQYRQQALNKNIKRVAECYENICKDYIEQNRVQTQMAHEKLQKGNESYQNMLISLRNGPKTMIIGDFGSKLEDSCQQQKMFVEMLKVVKKQPPQNINLIYPPSQSFRYDIQNYSDLVQYKPFNNKPLILDEHRRQIISPQFEACHSKWILKIYPSGFIGPNSPIKMKQIEYLSIYVQMIDSRCQGLNFKVNVDLIDDVSGKNFVQKSFKAIYVNGQSWGYDRYIRVSNLYKQNIISSQNRISIRVSLNIENYCKALLPVNRIISQKQKQAFDNDRRIRKLKAQLQQKRKQKQPNQTSNIKVIQKSQQIQRRTSIGSIIKGEPNLDQGISLHENDHQQIKKNSPQRKFKYPQISLQKPIRSKIIRLCSVRNDSLFNLNKNCSKVLNKTTSAYC